MLRERNIAYHPQHQVARVEPDSGTIYFSNGMGAHVDLLVYIPPHVAPDVVRQVGMPGESGWIPVDRHTMEIRFPVVSINDVTGGPMELDMPLPKAGVFAHH